MAQLTNGKDHLSSSQIESHPPGFEALTQGAAGSTLGASIEPGESSDLLAAPAEAPLFKTLLCMVCEDTGMVSTSTRNAAGAFLIGRCWNGCNASSSVVLQPDTGNCASIYGMGDVLGAGDKDMAQPERFTLRKGESTKKPWIIEDTYANPSEDAVLYHFPTEAKAIIFKAEMEAEHCQPTSFPVA